MNERAEVVVVGGGLAGLAAAAYAARAGRKVVLLEKAGEVGGRARTTVRQGFAMNVGAHALYRGGAGRQVLVELGVAHPGKSPPTRGGHAVRAGALHTLPVGLLSLLTTGVLDLSGKVELARLLARLPSMDTTALDRVTVTEWMADALKSPDARSVVAMLLRLSTYGSDMDLLSAGAAMAQLQLALREGVLYLDGGWATLVSGLRQVAEKAGASVRPASKVASIAVAGGRVRGVLFEDGGGIESDRVILAMSPRAASALAPDSAMLADHAERCIPVEAACVDRALSRLPRPGSLLALGVDRPIYLSVHSATARLAPEGGALVHTMRYGPSADAAADERELEELFELVQPGSRELEIARQHLPSIVVTHALPTAAQGGLAGRPAVDATGARGLFLAGDWVGETGMLADASLASAKRAAELALGATSAREAA